MSKDREEFFKSIEDFINKSDAPELSEDEQESLLLINTAYKHVKFIRAVFPAVEFLASSAAGLNMGSIFVKHLGLAAKEISEKASLKGLGIDIIFFDALAKGAVSAGFHAHTANPEACEGCSNKDSCELLKDEERKK